MRSLAAIVLLFFLSACEKEPPTKCLPPPDEGFEQYGFIIKDSTGRNLLTTTAANRLDTAIIKIIQPCTNNIGGDRQDEKGILRFYISIRPENGQVCNTAIVQWRDNDVDTLSYKVDTRPSGCNNGLQFYIDSASLKFNERKLERDTTIKKSYKAVFIINK